jgi:serine/threonine-protein kinase
VLRADVDGDVWQPAWPVFNADWHGAVAFAAWTAARTGQPWRLPTADEVEKAARGVDGRFYPWGDRFDASWCCMRDSHPGRPEPANVTDFPLDESPYGVRGLAGNVRAWCADGPSPGRRYDRGGFWLASATECRSADVHDHEETHRAAEVGVRLVRSV